MAVLIGCQSNPTAPDIDSQVWDTASSEPASGGVRQCLGYYSIAVDTKTLEAEPIPLRSAELHLNLTGILNTTMGIGVVGVPSESDPANGYISLNITLTHPFATKPQLSGFDVKGILMTPGTLSISPLVFADIDETRLKNADGYTRWWNPTEFTAPGMFGYIHGNLANAMGGQLTATVNPYKLFADRLEAMDSLSWVSGEPLDSDLGRAVFRAGSSNTRRYQIQFPMDPGPKVVYGYAVDCSWDSPDPNPPGEVPDDFPMAANQPEAYRVVLQPTLNSLYYDSESGTFGGVLKLLVNVHDWQGQAVADIPSEISAVKIFAPDLMPDAVDGVFWNETEFKARYTADLFGLTTPSEAGDTLIVARIGSTGGPMYDQGLGVPAPASNVSAWQVTELEIVDPECSVDANNLIEEAFTLDLVNATVDQLCSPTDYQDYFKMDFPLGHAISGDVTLYCDAEPTKLALYREEDLLTEVTVSGGSAAIDLEDFDVMPGVYHLRVRTETSDRAFLYAIEPNITLEDVTPNAVMVKAPGFYFDPEWVTLRGDYAYASSDNGFWICDYTDPLQPEVLSFLPVNVKSKPVLTFPYLYFHEMLPSNEHRINMIDVSNPLDPVLHEDLLTYSGWPCEMAVEPDWLYVCVIEVADNNIYIYDIATDKLAPTQYTMFTTFAEPRAMDFTYSDISSDYWLTFIDTDRRTTFFNITDKDNITAPSYIQYAAGYVLYDLTTDGKYAYTIHKNSIDEYWLACNSISLAVPQFEGQVQLVYPSMAMDFDNDNVYVASNSQTIYMYDVTDPTDPNPLWSFGTANDNYDVSADDDLVIFSNRPAGLQGRTIPEVGTPENTGRLWGLADPNHMVIDGNYLYTTESQSNYGAVKCVDISDPWNPVMMCEMTGPNLMNFIDVEGDRAILRVSSMEFYTVNASDPSNLTIEIFCNSGKLITCIGLTYDALYVGFSDSTITTIALNNWPNLGAAFPFSVSGVTECIKFNGSFMYVMTPGVVEIYSIVDPMTPTLLNTYTPLAPPENIVVDGDYLYIATVGSLEIADISDPMSPTFVASEPHPDAPHGEYIGVGNQFAVLQPYWTTPPTVMRVWPPDDPVVVGPLYSTDYGIKPNQVLLHDGYYYELDTGRAIRVWDVY